MAAAQCPGQNSSQMDWFSSDFSAGIDRSGTIRKNQTMKSHAVIISMLLIWAQLVFAHSLWAAAPEDRQQAADRQQLQALLDEFMIGASRNDRATHERFWADDLVYTSSSGERFGKQHILDGLADSEDSTEDAAEYRATEVNIRLLDSDVAVITFVLVADLPEQQRLHYLNTGVFTRHGDSWRASTWQATRSAAPADTDLQD